MHIYTAVMFVGLVGACAGAGSSWDYTDPAKWKDDSPICGWMKQSPININNPSCDKSLNESLTLEKYNNPGGSKFLLENKGYTLQLETESTGATIKLSKDGDTYKLRQIHFHWGKDEKTGSEHTLDGKMYPAEMHLVHYNSKYSFGDSVNETDGLAVLGVFIKGGGDENRYFKKFLNSVDKVVNASTNTTVDQFQIGDLLPENKDVFYRYSGSLTTPKCFQSVTWTVFHQIIDISDAQLEQFRSLKDSKGEKLVGNYRPVQDLNGRKITYWDEDKCPAGAHVLGASVFTVLVSMLFFFTI